VEIDRGEHCLSYVKDDIKENLIIENGNIFQVAEEMVEKNLRNVTLVCRARSCLYNRQDKCHANGITIIDGDDESDDTTITADCATYCKK